MEDSRVAEGWRDPSWSLSGRRYIRRPAIVAMLTSGCILMNTARIVSRTSVMLGIDGLPATGPKSGSFPAVPLIRFDKFRGKTVGFAL